MPHRLAFAALLLGMPAAMHAQQHAAGHGSHTEIAVPAGAGYTAADVGFMQGMIAHHAQAIHMSRLAAEHRADARLHLLAAKIGQSQVAEIAVMQDWLRRSGQAVPDTSSWRTVHMAGMLTLAELAALDAATCAEFEQAFLTLMIRHHEGAITRVKQLFASPGAGRRPALRSASRSTYSIWALRLRSSSSAHRCAADRISALMRSG